MLRIKMSSPNRTVPRVAVVYDHLLTAQGGAENVLQVVLKAFPEAPLFTTIYDDTQATWIAPERVRALSYPLLFRSLLKKREVLALLSPLLLEQHDFSGYDVVLSVTTTAAKGVLTTPQQLHISYVLSPPRYLYHQSNELLEKHQVLRLPLVRQVTEQIFKYLRWWDRAATARPEYLCTLSNVVVERIAELYGRKVENILHPPVTLQNTTKSSDTLPAFLLSLGRLVAYKRVDLAIEAARESKNMLCIAGTGRELSALISQAGEHAFVRTTQSLAQAFSEAQAAQSLILFLGAVSEAEKVQLLSQATAVLMPGLEDFGITALESVIAGTPVIIHEETGAREVLEESEYVAVSEQTTAAVVAAISRVKSKKITPKRQAELAETLSKNAFIRKLHNMVFPLWERRARMNPRYDKR